MSPQRCTKKLAENQLSTLIKVSACLIFWGDCVCDISFGGLHLGLRIAGGFLGFDLPEIRS